MRTISFCLAFVLSLIPSLVGAVLAVILAVTQGIPLINENTGMAAAMGGCGGLLLLILYYVVDDGRYFRLAVLITASPLAFLINHRRRMKAHKRHTLESVANRW